MKYGFDLITSDDGLSVIAKAVENLYILREKEKDAAVFGEIHRIATENGIDTYITLNEKAIINAFSKQIRRKVIRHGFNPNKMISTVSYTCPTCHSHISRTEYCPDCGQALDWSD